MSELSEYLYYIVSTCNGPISFSGDRSTVINRWLVKAQEADHYEAGNTRPFLKPTGRIIMSHELEFLSQEELESNWNMYCSLEWYRYLSHYNQIQKNIVLDKDKYIYALAAVCCLEEQEAMIYFTSTAPISIWINDQLVQTSNYDSFIRESTFVYKLKKGVNIFLVEKPYFLRHNDLKVNPDDFVITIKPYSFCMDQKDNYFFDRTLFEKFRYRYTIMLNKAVYEENDPVEALVLPRYFAPGLEEKEVILSAYDEKGRRLTSVETKTVTRVRLPIDQAYHGLIRLTAEIKDQYNTRVDNYLVIGDLLALMEKICDRAAKRKDCNPSILYSLRQLVLIPDIKTGMIHDFYQMMNTYIYYFMFEKLYEFLQYLQEPEYFRVRKPFDIFRFCAPIFHQYEIDENFFAYYVVLPKGYDSTKKYPVVFHIEYGYSMSLYPIYREYHRNQDFDDVILIDLCGRGGLNKDYIEESNLLHIIDGIVKEYNIDRERMYVVGACTGAMKGFGLAMRNPGLFAAAVGVNGTIRTDLQNPDYEQLENLETLSINHIFSVEDSDFNSSRIYDTFRHVKNAKLWPITSYSHEDFNESQNSSQIVKEVLKYTRNKYPKNLHFTTYDPIYNRCHWVQVEYMADLTKKAVVRATLQSTTQIRIECSNIARLRLLLDQEQMGLEQEISLFIEGRELQLSLYSYERVTIQWTAEGIECDSCALSKEEFDQRYDTIRVEESYMGIKQVYYHRCRILYSGSHREKKDATTKRLLRVLSLPLVERAKNYKYEKCIDEEVSEATLAEHNFVYLTSMEEKSERQQQVLKQAKVIMNEEKLVYNGVTYTGKCFIIVKCKNPYNEEKHTLLIAYTDDSVKQELLNLWGTFDTNGLFYGEAIVYHEGQYDSVR